MKLTRRELRKLIIEVAIQLSDEEVNAAKQKLEDEGGAAGPEMIAQTLKDAEEGDPDISDEDVLKALMSADEDIKLHSSGDVIDTSGLTERKKRKKAKKKKKLKKKGYLYPYGHGFRYDHDYDYDSEDIGFDGGGFDGGGGE